MLPFTHVAGLDNPSGTYYLFWSGIASQLDRIALLGVLWHHLNCHEDRCWRVGKRSRNHYCRKHHHPERDSG